MGRKEKIKKLVHSIYKELYLQATPSVDFDELVEEAKKNPDEKGLIKIPFEDYYLDNVKLSEIVEQKLKESALKLSTYEKDCIRHEIYLGSSPSSSRKKDKLDKVISEITEEINKVSENNFSTSEETEGYLYGLQKAISIVLKNKVS